MQWFTNTKVKARNQAPDKVSTLPLHGISVRDMSDQDAGMAAIGARIFVIYVFKQRLRKEGLPVLVGHPGQISPLCHALKSNQL